MELKVDSQRIKELRFCKSWSQEQLAQEANVSLRTIQRMELDGSASLKSRLAVAEALGVEPNDLDPAVEIENNTVENDNRKDYFSDFFAYPGPVGLSEKVRRILMVCLWFFMVSTGSILALTTLGIFVYFLVNPSDILGQLLVASIPLVVIFLISATMYAAFRRNNTVNKLD